MVVAFLGRFAGLDGGAKGFGLPQQQIPHSSSGSYRIFEVLPLQPRCLLFGFVLGLTLLFCSDVPFVGFAKSLSDSPTKK